MLNCMIAGVGGQGTVLASKLLAEAALSKGLDVRTAETIGMAQRGGSVVSHVRMGDAVHSPLIPLKSADILIALEPAEAVRMFPYLSEGGVVLVCSTSVKPMTSAGYSSEPMLDFLKVNVKKLTVIDGKELTKKCGSVKVLNVAMLGAAVAGGLFPFDMDDMEAALKEKLPEKYWDINISALNVGKVMFYA